MTQMSATMKRTLLAEGVVPEVVGALELAMVNAPSASVEAGAYAHGMQTAFDLYGLDGIKTQILYMLCNLGNWKGDEARKAKAILKKFK